MPKRIAPFVGAFYAPKFRESMKNLAVPMWSAAELWGDKESENNFRNCLVGSSEECASIWRKWFNEGVFEQDTAPAYYLLKQVFRFREKNYERWGFFASISTNDSDIKTHEEVSIEGAENTRQRFLAAGADLTPIFVGVEEKFGKDLRKLAMDLAKENVPLLVYQENKNSYHVLWRIFEKQKMEIISEFFGAKQFYLLDGHHRLRGCRDNFRMGNGDGRLMACISSMNDEDLVILPIHRSVICESWLLPELAVNRLKDLGCKIVRQVRWSQQSLEEILYNTEWNDSYFYFLPVQSAELFLMELPPSKNNLVVEKIEKDIFSQIPNANLIPTGDLHLLIDQLASGQAQAGIFLPPLDAHTVRAMADANKNLPRKSTQFFPKPALGLICRPWIK